MKKNVKIKACTMVMTLHKRSLFSVFTQSSDMVIFMSWQGPAMMEEDAGF